MQRRTFIEELGSAAAMLPLLPVPPQTAKPQIGIQIGAVSFIDEGVSQVLDTLQDDANVNALFIATFTYGRGIAGRQIPGQPLPDHGKQEYDTGFYGGNFARTHPQFYRDTPLKNIQSPDYGNFDVLEAVIPAAQARRLKTFCWYEDVFRRDLPGIDALQEVTLAGQRSSTVCFHNPGVQAFWRALTEDYVHSYPIDGLMWGSERQGPFGNAIGAMHGGAEADPRAVTCFCDFCKREAASRGIDTRRAIEGYSRLADLVLRGRAGRRPVDGVFVSYWRLLVTYPEILAWEKLWNDGQKGTYRAIFQVAKSVRPDLLVGWHIWHNNSFSPFYRAEQDYGAFREYSDFLKVVMYNNCGGPRLASYVKSISQTLLGDLSPQEALLFTYRVQRYNEADLAALPTQGLSVDYVAGETRRALQGAGTGLRIWPGIDIDIPTSAGEKKTSPADVRAAVTAALEAGAPGLILSRKYSEMRLANLSAAGQAVRSFKS